MNLKGRIAHPHRSLVGKLHPDIECMARWCRKGAYLVWNRTGGVPTTHDKKVNVYKVGVADGTGRELSAEA
jgi:hypothetical protein